MPNTRHMDLHNLIVGLYSPCSMAFIVCLDIPTASASAFCVISFSALATLIGIFLAIRSPLFPFLLPFGHCLSCIIMLRSMPCSITRYHTDYNMSNIFDIYFYLFYRKLCYFDFSILPLHGSAHQKSGRLTAAHSLLCVPQYRDDRYNQYAAEEITDAMNRVPRKSCDNPRNHPVKIQAK